MSIFEDAVEGIAQDESWEVATDEDDGWADTGLAIEGEDGDFLEAFDTLEDVGFVRVVGEVAEALGADYFGWQILECCFEAVAVDDGQHGEFP